MLLALLVGQHKVHLVCKKHDPVKGSLLMGCCSYLHKSGEVVSLSETDAVLSSSHIH